MRYQPRTIQHFGVVDPEKHLVWNLFCSSRQDAIEKFMVYHGYRSWKEAYNRGYRTVPVTIKFDGFQGRILYGTR